MAQSRINEIDFAKGVLITLMVMFHLAYIGDTYPYAKRIVYSFHMPAFLVISGYLANTDKTARAFAHATLWIIVPYAIMESGYIVAASHFNVREHIEHLSATVFLKTLFMRSLGPYWYLHTLVLCSTTNFIFTKSARRISLHNRLILCAISLYALSLTGIIGFTNAVYYFAGAVIRQKGIAFCEAFKPSYLAVIPIIMLCLFADLNSSSIESFTMTYFILSLLLRISKLRRTALIKFVGMNTMPIVLFSPVFTLPSKSFLRPLLSIDRSGLLFCFAAIAFTIGGCLGVAYIMDCARLSRFFIGKDRFLRHY